MLDNILGLTSISNYIWIIPIMISIHEVEEWNILKWYKKHYRNLPESTNTSIRIHIVVLSLLSFLLTFLADLSKGTFIFSMVVIFLSSFVLLNFLHHVIWTFQLKAYSYGLATASLCILSVVFVNIKLIRNDLITLPFYLMILLILPSLISTMKVKGEMTKEVRNVHCFFIGITKILTDFLGN